MSGTFEQKYSSNKLSEKNYDGFITTEIIEPEETHGDELTIYLKNNKKIYIDSEESFDDTLYTIITKNNFLDNFNGDLYYLYEYLIKLIESKT